MQNFSICKSKRKLVETLNRNRTHREKFFTRKKPSKFEHVQAMMNFLVRRRGRSFGSGRRGSKQKTTRISLRSERMEEQSEGGFVNTFQETFNNQ